VMVWEVLVVLAAAATALLPLSILLLALFGDCPAN
jgi:hypothetical protein